MAVNRDRNFRRSLSVAETALVAAALPPPRTAEDHLDFVEEEKLIWREEKRRLLNIDLNAPPQDDGDDYDYPLEVNDKIVVSGEDKLSVESECCLDFVGEIGSCGKPADSSVQNCEKKIDKTLSHCVRQKEDSKIDVEVSEIDSILIRRWKSLLYVTEIALRDYEQENLGKEVTRNKLSRNRRASRESELGGDWSTKKKKTVCSGSGSGSGGGGGVEVVRPPPVVRSTRGRTVALPNKFKDSFLGNVVAPESPRRSKSASTVPGVNRKSR